MRGSSPSGGIKGGRWNIPLLLLRLLGNLLYYLEFVPKRTQENMILADLVHGCLLARIEAIRPRTQPPA